jgi:uncharacterized protein YkvS
MNFELKVKDILFKTYVLTGKINNNKIINSLSDFVKNNKDKNLSNKTHVKGHFTGFKSLVENDDFINFLKIIQPSIHVIYKDNFLIQDAWGNLCKINEEITEHDHKHVSGFCGILYLSEGGPGTYFKEYDLLIKEEIGKFILFHPILKHSVEKIKNNIERITVAFNMAQIKDWDDISNLKWVNKKYNENNRD